jgi:hypothetical protein
VNTATFVFGAITLALLAISTWYGIKISVRKDREDRETVKAKALQEQIDARVAAELTRRDLAAALRKIEQLEGRPDDE